VLVQRILSKKPTLLRYSASKILGFNENGVDEFPHSPPSDDEAWRSYPERTWVLVDFNFKGPSNIQEPSGAIFDEKRKFFTIYMAHPDMYDYYRQFSQINNMPLRVIDQWDDEELAIGL
jgi:hypothetical protein